MPNPDIKSALKKRALELGFDDMRVAAACPVDAFNKEFFLNWIVEGKCDQMAYLKNNLDKRFDPAKLLEGAESIIILSAGFFRQSPERRVAIFAQGADYHPVLKSKLFELAKVLEAYGGKQKLCVDTVPVMEKYYAVKSGLGWRGKNSLIITQKNGPWQFLSLIITTLKIECDEPVKNRCGTCTRCIDACPTHALKRESPYFLDARLCISNLTIERKTPLNCAEKKLVKDKIFGCDECLRACPYSRFAKQAKMPEFRETLCLNDTVDTNQVLALIDSKRAQTSLRRHK